MEDVMSFWVAKDGETVVVGIEGQLVTANRQELKQLVLDEVERGERLFRIDCTDAGYIDSSGLGVLVSLAKKIRETRGELSLANLNDDLRHMFELTKLDTLFRIDDTRGDDFSGNTAPLYPRVPGPMYGQGQAPRPPDEASPR
jgi:anti-sigma B factor antagonist